MTYNVTVPNATQSPGVFPAQSNTNFDRLKAIINQEHNFLDTEPVPADSQGIHRRCTFINQATPVALPAGNGILYSANDAGGLAQLNWYNGTSNVQITPGVVTVVGSANVNAAAFETILANPGYDYVAWGWVTYNQSQSVGSPAVFVASKFSATNGVISNTHQTSFIPISYSGSNLRFQNSVIPAGVQTFNWALSITRLS